MEYAKEVEAQSRIRANISTLYEGNNKKNIPVKKGFEADLKNPKPILAQVIGENTRFTVAHWVDMEAWFRQLGFSDSQYMLVRDSYTVSTSFLDERLRQKAKGIANASILPPDR